MPGRTPSSRVASSSSTAAAPAVGAVGGGGGGAFFSPLSPLLSMIPGWVIPSQTHIDLLLLSMVIKVLLFPTYHSTDFEVHRNWLAITHSLPLRQWYFDAGSQWTLDYPPFFAYFSYILGIPNRWFGWGDARITALVDGLELANPSTKTYMRVSVVITELVLGAALVAHSRAPRQGRLSPGHLERQINEHQVRAFRTSSSPPTGGAAATIPETATQLPPSIRLLGKKTTRFFGGALDFDEATATLLAASVFFHPGLIIIDHIHFQYNGFLFGVLLWAIWAARERRLLLCAILFSSLLNLKHIYVYIAPAFTVFLLRTYVIPPGAESKLRTHPDIFFLAIERLLGLALVTLLPFAISIGPLVYDTLAHGDVSEPGVGGVLSQLLSRLFPFSRGLNHAYWAPNAWALWTFADRVALKLLRHRPSLGQLLPVYFSRNIGNASAVSSASRGLVGDTTFAVLPSIAPSVCFALTLLAMLPFLAYLWARPSYRRFLAALTGCAFASFLFGWHVHEKAILLVLIPFTPLAVQSYTHFRIWTLLSAAGIVSLFPLLFEVRETPIKLAYSVLWALMVGGQLKRKVYRPVPSNLGLIIHFLEDLYLLGLIPLQIYVDVVHPMLFSSASTAAVGTGAGSVAGAAVSAAAAAAAPVVSAAMSIVQPAVTPLRSVETAVAGGLGSVTAAAAAGAAAAVAAVAPTGILAADTSAATSTGVAAAVAGAAGSLAKAAGKVLPAVAQAADEGSLEFLPLMLTSVYCAVGVCWAWLRLGWACWMGEGEDSGAVGGIEGGEKNVVLEGSPEEEEEAARAGQHLQQQRHASHGDGPSGANGRGSYLLHQHHHHHQQASGPTALASPTFAHFSGGSGDNFPSPMLGGLGPAPGRIRAAPPSDDARSHRSNGSVRSNAARLRRQQGRSDSLGLPSEAAATAAAMGADGLGALPMPVRRRKVTATGAGPAATAAAAAATAAAAAAGAASGSGARPE
ncbi:glycosyl transferase [Tilletia horrida]|nr:glycosyl transferase [Tilletia horrida]